MAFLNWSRRNSGANARNARIFRETKRRLELEIRAITYRNVAKGLLKSGATIKEIVRALDETTVVALTEALDGIATVTQHASGKRKHLLVQLKASLVTHHATAREIAQQAIERIGLGGDFQHAVPLIEQAELRHCEKIADFGEGWTAPAMKPLKDRHPFIYDALLLLIGAALGVGAQSLASQLFGPDQTAKNSPPRTVVPDVDPARSRPPARVQNRS